MIYHDHSLLFSTFHTERNELLNPATAVPQPQVASTDEQPITRSAAASQRCALKLLGWRDSMVRLYWNVGVLTHISRFFFVAYIAPLDRVAISKYIFLQQ